MLRGRIRAIDTLLVEQLSRDDTNADVEDKNMQVVLYRREGPQTLISVCVAMLLSPTSSS